MANGLLDNKLQQPTAGMSYPEYHNIRSQQNAQSLLGRIGSGMYGFFKSPVQLGGQTERDILMAEIQNVLNEPRAKGEEISYADAYNIALQRLNPQPTTISQAVPQGRTYRPPKTTPISISPEIQTALEAENARQEQQYQSALSQGVNIDDSGNVIGIRLPMTTGVEFSTPEPTPQSLLNVGPPAPMEQIGPPAPLLEVPMGKPTMTQKSDRFVGPLAPEEPQSLGQRARGLLSGIGNLMGVGQPDFRDRLVIGLGSMTMQPNNPLTQQAMANIQARRQQAATQEAYERQQALAFEEFQREAQLQRELQTERIESAENIAANNALYDYMQVVAEKEGEMSEGRKTLDNLLVGQLGDWVGRSSIISQDFEVLNEMAEILDSMPEGSDFGRALQGVLAQGTSPLSRFLTGYFGQEQYNIQQAVEAIITKSLTDVLGAQFAASENVNYTSRLYNPLATPQENANRIRRLLGGLQGQAQQNQEMWDYFSENETFRGWEGPTSLTASLTDPIFAPLVINQPTMGNVPSFYQGN